MGLFGKKKGKAAVAPVAPVAPVQAAAPAWDGAKFKIQLRMARTRIEVQRTKRENSIVTNRRTSADHLRNGKEELARLYAEKTLRERAQMESYDVSMTYVELLIESSAFIGSIRSLNEALPDLKESVATVVYASQRMSVQELRVASSMLRSHFGADTIDALARGDQGPFLHCVNRLLAVKLDATSPDPAVVREELISIAHEYNVQWTAPPDTYSGAQPLYNPSFNFPPNPPPSAPYYPGGAPFGGGGGYAPAVNPAAIPGMAPPPPSTTSDMASMYAESSAPPSAPPSDAGYGYDDNLSRFNQLNK